VVGLLVDRTGFPLEISCFEGNTAETTTIVPIIEAFQRRHDLGGVPIVIAADAGMLSWTNLKALDGSGFSFIVGSRMTKAPGDLASHFRWHGESFDDGQVINEPRPPGSSPSAAITASSMKPASPGPARWSGSKAMSPTSTPHRCSPAR
jgi:hypothetical protein